MTLADRDGLESVSLRNVAKALNAGPMRLYGHVGTKDEMLDLMVDQIYRELLAAGPISKRSWRKGLREIARRMRAAARAHGWFVELIPGRHRVGPHALAFTEASLAAVREEAGFKSIDCAAQALRVLTAYVIGALQGEVGELRAEKQTGMTEAEWRNSHYPYLQRTLESGRFPMIAKLIQEAKHGTPDVEFDQGLECVLDGIALRLLR